MMILKSSGVCGLLQAFLIVPEDAHDLVREGWGLAIASCAGLRCMILFSAIDDRRGLGDNTSVEEGSAKTMSLPVAMLDCVDSWDYHCFCVWGLGV